MKRSYQLVQDGGHGWLSVPLTDLRALGLTDEISSYSYMTTARAYLEEDRDLTVFLNAAKAAGWQVAIKEPRRGEATAGRKAHPVRNYASYNRHWAQHPVVEGTLALYKHQLLRVTQIHNRRITLKNQNGEQLGATEQMFPRALTPTQMSLPVTPGASPARNTTYPQSATAEKRIRLSALTQLISRRDTMAIAALLGPDPSSPKTWLQTDPKNMYPAIHEVWTILAFRGSPEILDMLLDAGLTVPAGHDTSLLINALENPVMIPPLIALGKDPLKGSHFNNHLVSGPRVLISAASSPLVSPTFRDLYQYPIQTWMELVRPVVSDSQFWEQAHSVVTELMRNPATWAGEALRALPPLSPVRRLELCSPTRDYRPRKEHIRDFLEGQGLHEAARMFCAIAPDDPSTWRDILSAAIQPDQPAAGPAAEMSV